MNRMTQKEYQARKNDAFTVIAFDQTTGRRRITEGGLSLAKMSDEVVSHSQRGAVVKVYRSGDVIPTNGMSRDLKDYE